MPRSRLLIELQTSERFFSAIQSPFWPKWDWRVDLSEIYVTLCAESLYEHKESEYHK